MMTGLILRCSLLLLLLLTSCQEISGQMPIDANNPVVTTTLGRIRGTSLDIGAGKSVAAFIGIPYAAAPTRGNRFREPQPVVRWFGDFDATSNRVSCLQTDQRFILPSAGFSSYNSYIREDEDCLHLNVYVPTSRGGVSQRYPVIVYIHGGEFKYGGKDYYKPDLLLQQDVILVVPNYRLGVLGFLATDDENSPGNFGIRDQIAALRWVSAEIHAFSGDPNSVTIFGHDAGAISNGIHLFASESRGSVFTPWAFQEDPYYQAWTFAKIFNCWTDSRSLIRCLRERSASELISAASSNGYWFRPVVDKNLTRPLLKDFPRNLYERGEFARVPLLSGLVRNEGTLDYYKRYHLIKNSQKGNNKWAIEELIRPYVRRFTNLKVISTAIDYNYIQKYNNSMMGANRGGYGRQSGSIIPTNPNYHNGFILNQDEKFSEILGDFLFNAPVDLSLRLHSRLGLPTYLYVLSHKGSKSFGPLQKDSPREVTRDSYGVTHLDDTFYMIPSEYSPTDLDNTGKAVAAALTRCIYAFVNPLLGISGCNFRTPYTDQEPAYLNFGPWTAPLQATKFRDPSDMMFWNEFISDVIENTATPPPFFPYYQFEGFKAATWSLTAFVIIFLLLIIVLISFICMKKREDNRSMKLLRARDRELEERYRAEESSSST